MIDQAQAVKFGIRALKARGLHTTADLDQWIKTHPVTTPTGTHWMSRFSALKTICGEDAAVWLINDMAINQAKLDDRRSEQHDH